MLTLDPHKFLWIGFIEQFQYPPETTLKNFGDFLINGLLITPSKGSLTKITSLHNDTSQTEAIGNYDTVPD